ncbi:MAG: hypothetical protein LUE20_02910 [Oscillospiraceae bacterium]|nr:hypothetical protein [Oscillospiraceae bacterium]
MKKFLSIAVALVMVLSLTCVAFADTTVISVDLTGALESAGSWDNYGYSYEDDTALISLEDMAAIYEALNQEGSKLVLTLSNTAGWFQVGFNASTTAICFSGNTEGTDGYVAYTLETDGDNQVLTIDGQTVYDIVSTSDWYQFICGGELLLNVAVTVPDSADASAEEETTEAAEADTTDATEETTEAAEETTTSTSPATGVALALVPMAIAGFAVVSSKKR